MNLIISLYSPALFINVSIHEFRGGQLTQNVEQKSFLGD
jgi:hypothetical protein